MFALIRYFFLTLGFIFFVILVAVGYIWFANVWNVQTIFMAVTQDSAIVGAEVPESDEHSDGSPSVEQQKAMEDFGISADFFRELGEEERMCLTELLGDSRVEEIRDGAMPTPVEIARGSSCL